MDLVKVGEYLNCIEDTGFPGQTVGPHWRGVSPIADNGNDSEYSHRSMHGTYFTENGKWSFPWMTNTDVIENNPIQNSRQFLDIYNHLVKVQRQLYGANARPADPQAALRIISDAMPPSMPYGPFSAPAQNPITMQPSAYGLQGPSYDDMASAKPGYEMNVTINSLLGDNPNGHDIKTKVGEGL